MNAADLVALCDAHGIDFVGVAGASNNLKGIAGTRRRVTVEIETGVTEDSRKKQRITAPDTAIGKETRTPRPKAWSHVELGIAAYGVTALHWSAAQHTIANDRTPETMRVLMCGIRQYANKLATSHNWETTVPARRPPKRPRGRPPIGFNDAEYKTGVYLPSGPRRSILYLEQLCMLVLDEISFRPAFTPTPEHPELAQVFAIYMGVEDETWDKFLLERFTLLQQRYAVWYGSGLRMIQRGITGEDERAVVSAA